LLRPLTRTNMRWLTLGTSLSIAGVAAWYSIAGLIAIFSGSAVPIAIMGGVLEVGKLVTAAWLHSNWKVSPWWMRGYLTSAVVVLMLITSLGIFGFLSKAHLEHSIQSQVGQEIASQALERRIERKQRVIDDAETVLSQLDSQVQTLIDYDRIRGDDGAMAVRKEQKEERAELNTQIDEATDEVIQLNKQLDYGKKKQLQIEVEVGPLKYIAELIYGEENAEDNFDKAVRFVIMLLVFVFDPLAVVLLLAATTEFRREQTSKMFYDDGNLKVDPNNVVTVDDPLPYTPVAPVAPVVPEFVEVEEEIDVELDIPEDEDLEDYEVVVIEEEDGHGINLEVDPTEIVRKHEDGWYTQRGTPKG
jgi:hypothetical protein